LLGLFLPFRAEAYGHNSFKGRICLNTGFHHILFSVIYSSLFPEPLRPTVPQSYSPLPPMPSAPRPSALSTPSTMTPLFRSYASSINSTNVVNPAEVETVINREYANRDNNLKGKVSEPVSRSYGYTYPVPGTAPYFNPARSSLESNQATMGLNGSNEQMM